MGEEKRVWYNGNSNPVLAFTRALPDWRSPNFFSTPTHAQKEKSGPCINGLVDDLTINKLFAAGKVDDKCEKAGFERLTLLEKQFPSAAVLLHKIGKLPTAFQIIWSNERLLNIVAQFIGPNIVGHPVWNPRTKAPYNEQVTVPWHQDNGYLEETCIGTSLATAWIPLPLIMGACRWYQKDTN